MRKNKIHVFCLGVTGIAISTFPAMAQKEVETLNQQYRLFGNDMSHCSFAIPDGEKIYQVKSSIKRNSAKHQSQFLYLVRMDSKSLRPCAWIRIKSPEQIEFGRRAKSYKQQGLEHLTKEEAVKVFGKPKSTNENNTILVFDFRSTQRDSSSKDPLYLEIMFDNSTNYLCHKFSGFELSTAWINAKDKKEEEKKQERVNSSPAETLVPNFQ